MPARDMQEQPQTLKQTLRIELPVIAVIDEKQMTLGEVVRLAPGAVIPLGKSPGEPLDLMINDRRLGRGVPVRVGDALGLKITEIGTPQDTIQRLGR